MCAQAILEGCPSCPAPGGAFRDKVGPLFRNASRVMRGRLGSRESDKSPDCRVQGGPPWLAGSSAAPGSWMAALPAARGPPTSSGDVAADPASDNHEPGGKPMALGCHASPHSTGTLVRCRCQNRMAKRSAVVLYARIFIDQQSVVRSMMNACVSVRWRRCMS